MFKRLIIKYLKKMTKDDIISFSHKNNIELLPEEVDVLYDTIKKNYQELYEEDENVFNYLKSRLRNDVYQKCLELYYKYKLMYKIN